MAIITPSPLSVTSTSDQEECPSTRTSATIPPSDDSIIDCRKSDPFYSERGNDFRHVAAYWSLSSSQKSWSKDASSSKDALLFATSQRFIAASEMHFQSADPKEVSDDEIKSEMREAIVNLSRDRLISVRSLTHLDAVIDFAFRKYGSSVQAGSILNASLTFSHANQILSKSTMQFLKQAINTYCAMPTNTISLRDLLTAMRDDPTL